MMEVYKLVMRPGLIVIFSLIISACGSGGGGGSSSQVVDQGDALQDDSVDSIDESAGSEEANDDNAEAAEDSQSGSDNTIGDASEGGIEDIPDAGPVDDAAQDTAQDEQALAAECGVDACKPLPFGVFESAGINDPVGNAPDSTALKGVLLRINWNDCASDDNIDCVLDQVQQQLDAATDAAIQVNLIIMDGDSAPDFVKDSCVTFAYEKRGELAEMCLAWDLNYLAHKQALVGALGERFDSHPALALMYFTGACSGNGAEGHCRVDEVAYTAAGYTPEILSAAYKTIMDMYRAAFPTTPIAFEVHEIFNSADLWQNLWDHVAESKRVGVAAWWCSERLSVNGADTVGVFPIVQEAALNSFSVCQTVASFTGEPNRFTDISLGLDYGASDEFSVADSQLAFDQTLDWIQGLDVHVGQPAVIERFSVVEIWSQDLKNEDFQNRLLLF
ncbi:MAG: hypothetical protein KUG79_02625 [Pseudomonadales bacterium]|nr:hypothetical protein [Pseudomonadales bacterium]